MEPDCADYTHADIQANTDVELTDQRVFLSIFHYPAEKNIEMSTVQHLEWRLCVS